MKNSRIQWTDHTFNPWEGCTKVSPGCAHCYAEARNHRFSAGANWGPGAPRRRTTPANWHQPKYWQWQGIAICPDCAAELSAKLQHGSGIPLTCATCFCGSTNAPQTFRRPRVFSASLADWLDPEVPIEWLADFLYLVWSCQNLDWQLLTKRPEHWRERIRGVIFFVSLRVGDELKAFPQASEFLMWLEEWIGEAIGITARPPANVWLGTTTEDQPRADERVPTLLEIPAAVHFLSIEPMLESVELRPEWIELELQAFGGHGAKFFPRIDWVICGGESGPVARPMHPAWARSLREQCEAASVPFFFKQWGNWLPEHQEFGPPAHGAARSKRSASNGAAPCSEIHTFPDGQRTFRMGKLTTGRLLDGLEHNSFPAASNGRSEPTQPQPPK